MSQAAAPAPGTPPRPIRRAAGRDVRVLGVKGTIEKVRLIKEAAGDRFADIELYRTGDDIPTSPPVAIGTFEEIAEPVRNVRAPTSMSYGGVFPIRWMRSRRSSRYRGRDSRRMCSPRSGDRSWACSVTCPWFEYI